MTEHSRSRINRLSALCALAFIVLIMPFSDSSFTKRINDISENLDIALYEVLDRLVVNYTALNEASTTTKYLSTTKFNPRGMAPLFNVTNKFMDFIIAKDFFPKDILIRRNPSTPAPSSFHPHHLLQIYQLGTVDPDSLLNRYAGLLAVVVCLLVFGLLMPICGLCFCCCRCCCGNCGASRTQAFDRKGDCCRKCLFGSLLIALGTLMLFGVVCAFVSNQHIKDGTEEFASNMRRSIRDTDMYLNTTDREINILLKKNYREFEFVIFDTLDRSSLILYDQLAHYSNAVAMSEVSNIVDGLGDIQKNLTTLKHSTNGLRVNASQLNDAMRKVKKELLSTLHNCQALPECKALSNDYISKLGTEIDFNSLPDISTEMAGLEDIMHTNLINEIRSSQSKLTGIKDQIQRKVTAQLEEVRKAIKQAGAEIDKNVKNVSDVLHSTSRAIHSTADEPLNLADYYIHRYGPYQYYAGLTVSCILLSISICLAFGLLCGICGKRPDGYTDDCCNKGAGGKCLMMAVAIMFLLGIVLAAVCIIYFVAGILTQRTICDTAREPRQSEALKFFSRELELPKRFGLAPDTDLASLIESCHRNASIYKVLRLRRLFNASDIRGYAHRYDVDGALVKLQKEIDRITIDGNILSEEAKASLNDLARSGISDIKFYKFTEVLDHNLTSVNLTILSDQLRQLIHSIEASHPELYEVLAGLKNSALNIETYQDRLVNPMVRNATRVIEMAHFMEEHLKFGKDSFQEAIKDLILEVQHAEVYLKVNASTTLKKITVDFTKAIEKQVVAYLDRIADKIENKVGQCGPMSLVVNATLVSTCEKILYPVNGFWFGILWCLILFIPTIIVSVKLASLYQKHDNYPGTFVEAEYLCYASEREQIPLASGKGKRKYKKPKRHDRSAYRAEMGDGNTREYATTSNHLADGRYSDQANKHWEDFPNGGPPQYHRAPTEYERPPPYYFPGASDQN